VYKYRWRKSWTTRDVINNTIPFPDDYVTFDICSISRWSRRTTIARFSEFLITNRIRANVYNGTECINTYICIYVCVRRWRSDWFSSNFRNEKKINHVIGRKLLETRLATYTCVHFAVSLYKTTITIVTLLLGY